MLWNPLMLEAQTKARIGLPTQTSEAQYGTQGRTFFRPALQLSRCYDNRISLYAFTCNIE